jgi:RNA-directed DNA polymerase
MLFINYDKSLAAKLGVTRGQLERILENAENYYRQLTLHNPAKPDKPRNVVEVCGVLRTLQSRLYRRLLLPRLPVSPFSHGGVLGRTIKTNFLPHANSVFVFKADISNFYPSIHRGRVYRLFVEQFCCVPNVARLCTKLCTYDNHLALGLVTSPILANQVLNPIDERIDGACRKAGLVYTRFVDDITISGPYDLKKSGVPKLVGDILRENGFRIHPEKQQFGKLVDGMAVTGVRLNRRKHLDVQREYADELERQLAAAKSLERGERIERPYYTRSQISGRVHFVCWINPSRGAELLRQYRSIRWSAVEATAKLQKLVVCAKQITKRGQKPEPIRA